MAVAKSEGTGFVARTNRYFRSMVHEMKKVHWPSRRNTAVYTAVVVIACAFVSALIWIMDLGIGSLLNLIIK
ncbi:MAG TPA: preprotein translocase subunit SecE [Peptococcaceae bacterium]|nr:preprotein translocase subunit SecE [Peptococcaceae bacterium]